MDAKLDEENSILGDEEHCLGTEEGPCVRLALPLPPNFSLSKAVCSYGFFMMAPNTWVVSPASSSAAPNSYLERPLRLLDGRAVLAKISQSNDKLCICILGIDILIDADKEHLLAQVFRMLRLSQIESSAIASFHGLHAQAKVDGFGRLFRSPTLFEDMIKSLLLCNCGWGRTLTMARALCELQAELKGPPLGYCETRLNVVQWPSTPDGRDLKRKRCSKKKKCSKVRRLLKFDETAEGRTLHVEAVSRHFENQEEKMCYASADEDDLCRRDSLPPHFSRQVIGAFPTPEELCAFDAKFLAKRCGLGYRAESISQLAKNICDGIIDLQSLGYAETEPSFRSDARLRLLQMHGFGPFTSANVLMCMGDYSVIPADTETIRHLKQVHGRSKCSTASVLEDVATLYAPYKPYQFLSYWFELWGSYEQRFGKLNCMDPCCYSLFTGRNMRCKPPGS